MRFTRRHRGATFLEVAVVVGLTGALMGLLLPALSSAIDNAQGSTCRNNLSRLAQALNAYHDARGKYPPGGQGAANDSGYSTNYKPNWVILALPYMGQEALYDSVNWTQVNQTSGGLTAYSVSTGVKYGAFTSTEISSVLCPSDSSNNTTNYRVNRNTSAFGPPPANSYQSYGRLNYAANACLMPPFWYGDANFGLGVNAFPCGGPTQAGWALTSPYSWKTRGVMGLNTSLSRTQITDGTTKTILLGETRAGLNQFDSRGVWADGRAAGSTTWFHMWGPGYCYDDVGDVSEINATMGALGNGNVTVGHQLALQQCMDTFDSYSGRPQGNFRSQHGAGFFSAMCDGSVRFISNSVEFANHAAEDGGVYGWPMNGSLTDMLTWERLNASGDGLVVDDSTDPNFSSTVALFILGDMNGDGVLDNMDIAAMELALADPAAYLALYPNLTDYQQRGDIDQSGSFDNFDIGAFEIMLVGSH